MVARQRRGELGRGPENLAARLRERREEIEDAMLSRVLALSDPPMAAGPEYAAGLRLAVAAGVEQGIAAIEGVEGERRPVPAPLLAQAQLAARSGVGLDTVLRRYLAGNALLGDFLMREAEGRLPPAELKGLLGRLNAAADRLIAAASAAYTEEAQARGRGTERRRAELVERLLAGEPLDASELGYRLQGHHLALVATGVGGKQATQTLARELGAALLVVQGGGDGEVLWAWLGRREPIDPEDTRRRAEATWPPKVALALGEPGEGLAGWRLSHRQARAALPIALRGPQALVRYADVTLLASILQDDLLATSLRRLYLEPLEAERDGGATLRETLRAYFACDRNGASAAAALGVCRQTVNRRLQMAEARIGRPLLAVSPELDTALRLAEMESSPRAWSAG